MDEDIIMASENTFSRKLFRYLSDVIGTEKVVEARRLFYKTMDSALTNKKTIFISSGSRAEGLDMAGSDFDIMHVLRLLPVYCTKAEVECPIGYIADTENAPPGFVLLKKIWQSLWFAEFESAHMLTEDGLVLSNELFKLLIQRKLPVVFGRTKIHGPCITDYSHNFDVVHCLQSRTWPSIAMKWLYRPRCSEWPSSNTISKISHEGLLYVPIGSKFGLSAGNPLEWRISFSVPEKILIHSFNHTQLLCYAMLKIMLKEIIISESSINQLLCSYFMKTTVFWLSEETDPSTWIPENLFLCFRNCLKRLIYWVRLGYCPNYFIPENNMFEGKILGTDQEKLLQFLETLYNEGIQIIHRSDTLRQVLHSDIVYDVPQCIGDDIDRGIYPLLTLLNNFFGLGNFNNEHSLSFFLRAIRKSCVGKLHKSLYLELLVRNGARKLMNTPYCSTDTNKVIYPGYKRCLFHGLIGKNTDSISSWLLLATFFYLNKEYYKALSVIHYTMSECTPEKIYHDPFQKLIFDGNPYRSKNTTYLQRLKLSCIYPICRLVDHRSLLHSSDLAFSLPQASFLISPPVVFVHFLRFMCYHHLGKTHERNRCFYDMKYTIEEDFFIGSAISRLHAYQNLLKASLTAGLFSEACQCGFKAWSETTKNQRFLAYIAALNNALQ